MIVGIIGCAAVSADFDDSILFVEDILPGTITLSDGVITFQGSAHVLGPGSKRLTVSGNNTDRIFWISDSDSGTIQNVSIKGLTLSSGASSLGGSLDVHRASISNNANGGVVSFGTVNVTENFIFDNSSYSGAGLRAGGSGNLFIENSTI